MPANSNHSTERMQPAMARVVNTPGGSLPAYTLMSRPLSVPQGISLPSTFTPAPPPPVYAAPSPAVPGLGTGGDLLSQLNQMLSGAAPPVFPRRVPPPAQVAPPAASMQPQYYMREDGTLQDITHLFQPPVAPRVAAPTHVAPRVAAPAPVAPVPFVPAPSPVVVSMPAPPVASSVPPASAKPEARVKAAKTTKSRGKSPAGGVKKRKKKKTTRARSAPKSPRGLKSARPAGVPRAKKAPSSDGAPVPRRRQAVSKAEAPSAAAAAASSSSSSVAAPRPPVKEKVAKPMSKAMATFMESIGHFDAEYNPDDRGIAGYDREGYFHLEGYPVSSDHALEVNDRSGENYPNLVRVDNAIVGLCENETDCGVVFPSRQVLYTGRGQPVVTGWRMTVNDPRNGEMYLVRDNRAGLPKPVVEPVPASLRDPSRAFNDAYLCNSQSRLYWLFFNEDVDKLDLEHDEEVWGSICAMNANDPSRIVSLRQFDANGDIWTIAYVTTKGGAGYWVDYPSRRVVVVDPTSPAGYSPMKPSMWLTPPRWPDGVQFVLADPRYRRNDNDLFLSRKSDIQPSERVDDDGHVRTLELPDIVGPR